MMRNKENAGLLEMEEKKQKKKKKLREIGTTDGDGRAAEVVGLEEKK